MRKNISTSVDESLLGVGNLTNRRIMNDIMYYLRKILKLARRVQTGAFESYSEYESEMTSIKEEIKRIEKDINQGRS